jgi:hypothetical protein
MCGAEAAGTPGRIDRTDTVQEMNERGREHNRESPTVDPEAAVAQTGGQNAELFRSPLCCSKDEFLSIALQRVLVQ